MSLPPPSIPRALAHRFPSLVALAAAALLAACGQQQHGGFQGFPPAQVTTMVVQPRTLPATYEYVGQTRARRRSRCARG